MVEVEVRRQWMVDSEGVVSPDVPLLFLTLGRDFGFRRSITRSVVYRMDVVFPGYLARQSLHDHLRAFAADAEAVQLGSERAGVPVPALHDRVIMATVTATEPPLVEQPCDCEIYQTCAKCRRDNATT